MYLGDPEGIVVALQQRVLPEVIPIGFTFFT